MTCRGGRLSTSPRRLGASHVWDTILLQHYHISLASDPHQKGLGEFVSRQVHRVKMRFHDVVAVVEGQICLTYPSMLTCVIYSEKIPRSGS